MPCKYYDSGAHFLSMVEVVGMVWLELLEFGHNGLFFTTNLLNKQSDQVDSPGSASIVLM